MKCPLGKVLRLGFFALCGAVILSGNSVAHAKTVTLNFSYHVPPISPVAKALDGWAKKVEEETGGAVKILTYPSGTLVKGSEAYTSTVSGVCDIAFANNVYERDRWALNQVVTLDALPIPTDARGVELWDKLWQKFPQMKEEFKGVKVLSHVITTTTSLHTQKEVRSPADLKGMKIAGFGAKIKILENVGAAPVGLAANDWYLSLEKGVIQGAFCPIHLLVERGIEELTPYHLDLKMGQNGSNIIMSERTWKKLTPEVQAVFEKLYDWGNEQVYTALNTLEKDSWEKCRNLKKTSVIEPTAEDRASWLMAAEPVAKFWIRQNAKKGPTQEIYDYARWLADEMNK